MRIHTRAALLATTAALLCVPTQAAASADGVIVKFRSGATAAADRRADPAGRRWARSPTRSEEPTRSSSAPATPRKLAAALERSGARRLRGEEQDSSHAGDAERFALQQPLRPEQHRPDRRHERRRHRRARGLGRRRARRLPVDRRGRRSASSTPASSPSHPDLAGKVANCAQSHGHPADLLRHDPGRHRAPTTTGTAPTSPARSSANANNGIGVTGVAFNSPLAICKALGGPLGTGSTADVANCITWAHDKGAKVISMSLGGGASTTLKNAVDYAWKSGGANGSVLIAAAGNDGDATLNYPAAYPNVVSVAATDDTRRSRELLERERGRRDRGARRRHPVDLERRRLQHDLGHVDGDAARRGRRRGDQGKNPAHGRAGRLQARRVGRRPGAAGRDQSFGFGRVNLRRPRLTF